MKGALRGHFSAVDRNGSLQCSVPSHSGLGIYRRRVIAGRHPCCQYCVNTALPTSYQMVKMGFSLRSGISNRQRRADVVAEERNEGSGVRPTRKAVAAKFSDSIILQSWENVLEKALSGTGGE